MSDTIEYNAVVEVLDVKTALSKYNIDESIQQNILAELSVVADEYAAQLKDKINSGEEESNNVQEEKDKEPRVKKEFILLLSDPEHKITSEHFGWAFQMEEDQNPGELVDKIKMAAGDFNRSKKGQKVPVNSIGETIQNVSSKFFKEYKIYPKHKEPVYICITDNKLV